MSTLTPEQATEILADVKRFGWARCPGCGWAGITLTTKGAIRAHGRKQTGNGGLGCPFSGARVTP